MKKLLLIPFLALTLNAQTTNITFTIKVTTDVSTNTVNLNATSNYVAGFSLAYARNISANGTNAPTFIQFVKQETADRLQSLAAEAVDDQLSKNKVTTAAAQLPAIWPTMTAQDQSTLALLLQKYVP